MTNTYLTGNPLGSKAPKDLYDNASNFDEAMNSTSPSFQDRFLKRRETWAGMEQAFSDFLVASGFEFIGDYDADGPLTVTRANQVFTKDGEYWSAGPSLVLPYTTVNNWVVDQPKFVSRGDSIIRQDLASTDPAKGVSLVAGSVRHLANAAALRTLPKTGVPFAMTQGFFTAGDMGNSLYRLDLTDTTSPDNGFDIWVNPSDGARWKLSHQGPIYARQAGAKLDGITDDTAAIQLALNRYGSVIINYTPEGTMLGGLLMTETMRLRGEGGVLTGAESPVSGGQRTTIRLAPAAAFGIKINNFTIGNYVRIEDFRFEGTGSSASAIRFGIGFGTVYGIRIKDISFMNCVEAIGDEAPFSSTSWIHDVKVSGVDCTYTRGRQIYSRYSNGFIKFEDVKIDHTNNPSQITWESARFENIAGLELSRFDVLGAGSATPTYLASSIAIAIVGGLGLNASVWMDRVLVDFTRGLGIYIQDVFNVVAKQTGVHLTLGDSITLNNVTKSRFSQTSVFGAKLIAGAPAFAAGIKLIGGSDNDFSEYYVERCTGPGVALVNTVRNTFSQGTVTDNNDIGFLETGTSNSNTKSQLRSFANVLGSLTQVGAQSAAVNWMANSGTFIPSTIGPVVFP